MCASSQPTPPDPYETAAAQTQSNKDTAITQAGLNMTNQLTPYGTLVYEQIGTWDDGTPRYQATTKLDPAQQRLLDTTTGAKQNLADTAKMLSGGLGDILGQPLDWSSQQKYLNDLTAQNLDPLWARKRDQQYQDLADRGVGMNSTAFTNAFQDFDRAQSMSYNDANLNNFSTALSSALAMRNQPINEINAIMSGAQVQNPTFASTPQTGVAGTDIAGLVSQNYGQQVNAYNQQQQNLGGLFGTIGNVTAAALPFILSDERAKEGIKRVGKTDEGTPIYTYRYKGDESGTTHMGVMAQEVQKKNPGAVVPMGSLLAVDYRKVA